MTPERWREITGLFHAVRECVPAQRDALRADACWRDAALGRELAALNHPHIAAIHGLEGADRLRGLPSSNRSKAQRWQTDSLPVRSRSREFPCE